MHTSINAPAAPAAFAIQDYNDQTLQQFWYVISASDTADEKLTEKDVLKWVIANVTADYSYGKATSADEVDDSRLRKIFSKFGEGYAKPLGENSTAKSYLSSYANKLYENIQHSAESSYGGSPSKYVTREGWMAFMGWKPEGYVYGDNEDNRGVLFGYLCKAANNDEEIDSQDLNKRVDEFLKAGFGDEYDGRLLSEKQIAALKYKWGKKFDYDLDEGKSIIRLSANGDLNRDAVAKTDYIKAIITNLQADYAKKHHTKIDDKVSKEEFWAATHN